jgi:hypothetical protein
VIEELLDAVDAHASSVELSIGLTSRTPNVASISAALRVVSWQALPVRVR